MRIYVVGFFIALDLAGSIKFTEGTGPTDLTGVIPIATSNYIDVWADGNEPVIATNTANAKLSITTVTGKAFGWLRYYIA